MARSRSEVLTDREAQLMEILWQLGPLSAEAVREALPERPHDSTVRTLLRILQKKRYVRIRGQQPAIYQPIVTRARAQSKATRNLLARFFGGSVTELVHRLVEDDQLSPNELDEIHKILQQRKRQGGCK
jgi:BlaI family transcriptional regulator, penicillinase repressor